MEFQKGFRGKIEDYFDTSADIKISMSVSGPSEYDTCCFSVDSSGKLPDESYMIFYNQMKSPQNEIVFSQNGATSIYTVNLSKLPSHINKLIFTVSIDGKGVMGDIASLLVNISQNKGSKFKLTGKDFLNEKAVIVIEIYKKEVWRISAVGSGFDGGLPSLLQYYGGEKAKINSRKFEKKQEIIQEKNSEQNIIKHAQKIEFQKGFRGKIEDYFEPSADIKISVSVSGPSEYDTCCFGVDSSGKFSDESYMIFYNQTKSPQNEIVFSQNGATSIYTVNLSKFPFHINKLVFAVSINGKGVLRDITSLLITISQNKSSKFKLTGKDFLNEKAVIAIEIYKKEVWRISTVGSGFDRGLPSLLKYYGGAEARFKERNKEEVSETLPASYCEKIELKKGQKIILEKNEKLHAGFIDFLQEIYVGIAVSGSAECKICCLCVDGCEQLIDEKYLIYDQNLKTPGNELMVIRSGVVNLIQVNLSKLPQNVSKLIFAVGTKDNNSFAKQINLIRFNISQSQKEVIGFKIDGKDNEKNKSMILFEIYKKDIWRAYASGLGFRKNLESLLKNYGYEKPTAAQTASSELLPDNSKEVFSDPYNSYFSGLNSINSGLDEEKGTAELKIGQKIILEKLVDSSEYIINLTWKKSSSKPSKVNVDLDLGCLCEMQNGEQYLVTALGDNYGSLDSPPYVELDWDDKTGSGGENLQIRGKKGNNIKRMLLFVLIYAGLSNWKQLDSAITIKQSGGCDVLIPIERTGLSKKICAAVSFENNKGRFAVQRIMKFVNGFEELYGTFSYSLKVPPMKKDT